METVRIILLVGVGLVGGYIFRLLIEDYNRKKKDL